MSDTFFIHVPLLVRWPARFSVGARVDSPVSLVDVVPTVLDAVGGESPEVDGQSLLRQSDPVAAQRRVLYCSHDTHMAVRGGGWKLVYDSGDAWLYDLANDPSEQTDVKASEPERFAELVQLLEKMQSCGQARQDNADTALTEDEQEMLRSLGYVE